MAGKKSTTEKKVYTIGGEEVTDLKQITLPMIKRHVKELGKKDVKWLVDFMKTEVEKRTRTERKLCVFRPILKLETNLHANTSQTLPQKGQQKKQP